MSEDRTQQLPGGDLGEILSILRSIDGRLTELEDKVERRLQDTRPIWEQVLTRLTEVEERLTKGLKKVEDEVDSLGRRFREFNRDTLKLQNRDDDLTERMDRIEAEQAR